MLDLERIFDPDRAGQREDYRGCPADPLDGITPDDLSPEWHFLWLERCCIMVNDGGLHPEYAEAAALADVIEEMRRAGVRRVEGDRR